MRILTPKFVVTFKNRIINIHHSFLPAFTGVKPYEQAFKRGVKIIGATSHFVSKDLDEGPIIVQEIVHIDHKYTVKDMKLAGREVEITALSKALKLVFEDKVFISNNKTIIFE
jgi:formyltetrahydrofolate deformylase